MTSRAGIVVTGTEVLTGRVADQNGPWLAERLREIGVDVAHVIVVGDRPDDLRAALQFFRPRVSLVITTGGLGPTADDLTADVVAAVQGREMRLDPELEQRIANVVDRLSRHRGWRMHPHATAAATRKQARVPDGADVLEPVGTAPGLVVPSTDGAPPVLVLPGPPRELRGMWPDAVASPLVKQALGSGEELRQRTIRLWGTPESELAAVLRDVDYSSLEVTTCLRDGGELEVVTRYGPAQETDYQRLSDALARAFPDTAFSLDGRTIDEIVADGFLETGRTVALAESCTGGMLAARLTDRPGSSAYVLAGLVTYSNEAKQRLLGVPADLIERVGAVSKDVAIAMAHGARERIGADVGVGITGVAGPGGGTPDKPVGLVHLCVATADRTLHRRITAPGSRYDVRYRSVVVALHMLRDLLGNGDPGQSFGHTRLREEAADSRAGRAPTERLR